MAPNYTCASDSWLCSAMLRPRNTPSSSPPPAVMAVVTMLPRSRSTSAKAIAMTNPSPSVPAYCFASFFVSFFTPTWNTSHCENPFAPASEGQSPYQYTVPQFDRQARALNRLSVRFHLVFVASDVSGCVGPGRLTVPDCGASPRA
jgi:hypothetical protein